MRDQVPLTISRKWNMTCFLGKKPIVLETCPFCNICPFLMFIFAGDSRGKNTNLIRKKTASDFGEFTDKALASFNNLGSSAAAAA